MTLTIRWRLTLWYGAVLAVCLAAFGTAVYVLTSRSQLARIDFELSEELHELQHDVVTVQDRETLLRELQSEFGKHPAYEFEIAQSDGEVRFRSDRLGTQSLETVSATTSVSSEPRFLELSGLGRYRVQAQWIDSPHGRLALRAAIPLDAVEAAQRTLWRTLCLMGPLVLAAAMAGGYWLARRALSPVERITATAETITANQLDQRLEVLPVQDELSRLARTLNDMIDRLQHSFEDMRRFTADAAHELRTPITLLRTQLDVALRSDRSNDEYRNVLLSLRDDVAQFGRLASQLLELSREDAGLDAAPFAPLRLEAVLIEAVEELRSAADQKALSLQIESLAECEVHGDADRLRRVFLNLLDNAIKFTPPRGRIRISLDVASPELGLLSGTALAAGVGRSDEPAASAVPLRKTTPMAVRGITAASSGSRVVTATIQDTGVGISPEHLPRIFDRFYQADPSRSDDAGTGLGLAICRAIATAHHGTIRVSSMPGQGTTVEVELPLANGFAKSC